MTRLKSLRRALNAWRWRMVRKITTPLRWPAPKWLTAISLVFLVAGLVCLGTADAFAPVPSWAHMLVFGAGALGLSVGCYQAAIRVVRNEAIAELNEQMRIASLNDA